jgi:hypothetical protein
VGRGRRPGRARAALARGGGGGAGAGSGVQQVRHGGLPLPVRTFLGFAYERFQEGFILDFSWTKLSTLAAAFRKGIMAVDLFW